MATTPQLPQTFWPQILARLGEKSPRLYKIIITNSIWFTVACAALPFVVTDVLPGIGVVVPMWLTYANTKLVIVFSALAGVGIGSMAVSATTVQTAATPPLATDVPADANTLLLERLATIEHELAEIKNAKSSQV